LTSPSGLKYIINVVKLGDSSVGTGIRRVVEQGNTYPFRTRFFTAAQLVVRLSEAFSNGSLEKVLSSILKAQLLIIDEWGYVPIDKQGAHLLFRVISDSYERRSLIITTNLEFSKWGSIFTDDQMAAAMIDRLAHYGYILFFEGESYRMKNAHMRQKR
jgi:DNA replication protein DnaC